MKYVTTKNINYSSILNTPFNDKLNINCTVYAGNYKGTTNIRKPNIQYI